MCFGYGSGRSSSSYDPDDYGGGVPTSACKQPSFTINTSDDAQTLSDCGAFDGDVEISNSTTGDIDLGPLTAIGGSLNVGGASQMSGLAASSLESVGGTFALDSLTTLTALNLPALTAVGTMRWVNLPSLQSFNASFGITKAQDVAISDTALDSVEGLNFTRVASIAITGNENLDSIHLNNLASVAGPLQITDNAWNTVVELPVLAHAGSVSLSNLSDVSIAALSQVDGDFMIAQSSFTRLSLSNLTTVGGTFRLTDNAKLSSADIPILRIINNGIMLSGSPGLALELPTLERAGSMSVGNVSEVSIPSLSQVDGDFLIAQSSFTKLSVSNLTTIDGTVGLTDNAKLSEVDVPSLQTIGNGIMLSGCPDLASISFPSLTTVSGDVNFTGAFDAIDLPKLEDVSGNVYVKTNSRERDICKYIKHKKSEVEGKVQCIDRATRLLVSKGGIAGIVIGSLAAILLLVTCIYCCRPKRSQEDDASSIDYGSGSDIEASEPPPSYRSATSTRSYQPQRADRGRGHRQQRPRISLNEYIGETRAGSIIASLRSRSSRTARSTTPELENDVQQQAEPGQGGAGVLHRLVRPLSGLFEAGGPSSNRSRRPARSHVNEAGGAPSNRSRRSAQGGVDETGGRPSTRSPRSTRSRVYEAGGTPSSRNHGSPRSGRTLPRTRLRPEVTQMAENSPSTLSALPSPLAGPSGFQRPTRTFSIESDPDPWYERL